MRRIINKLRELYSNRAEIRRQARWLFAQAKPCLPYLLVLFLIQAVGSVISVGLTLVNRRIIDHAIQVSGMFDTYAFILLVVLTLVNMMVGGGGSIITMLVSEKYVFGMRSRLFERLLHSKWMHLKKYHSGDIQTRLISDLDTVTNGIMEIVPGLLGLFVRLLLAFAVLYRFDHMLALTALVLGPLGVLCSFVVMGPMHSIQTQVRENDSQIRSFTQEKMENVTVVKAFSMERQTVERFNSLKAKRIELVRKKSIVSALGRMAMHLVFSAGHLLAFGWGILRVSRAEITYGTMSVFLSLVGQIQSPVMGLSNLMAQLITVLASAGRLMELEAMDAETPQTDTGLRGQVGIKLEDVSFVYEKGTEDHEPVLSHISMLINPGECVALVGTTGSGKTTIARLLLSLVDPMEGQVAFFDKQGNVAEASPSTRSLIAYVPQGNTLSSGTIRQNLLTGEQTGEEEILAALKTAEAQFALELGLDTKIGERGVGLSEGQAQRLAIARALLRKAPFLILDEASASLDMETERRIMENLRQSKQNITCLVITHRPSLLAICDRCFRVENGVVTEQKAGADPDEWI